MQNCPKCGSNNLVRQLPATASAITLQYLRCANCGNEFVTDTKKTEGVAPPAADRPTEK